MLSVHSFPEPRNMSLFYNLSCFLPYFPQRSCVQSTVQSPASARPLGTLLTSWSVSSFLQGYTLSPIMSVCLRTHHLSVSGWVTWLSPDTVSACAKPELVFQGDVYEITTNRWREKPQVVTKASGVINITGFCSHVFLPVFMWYFICKDSMMWWLYITWWSGETTVKL